MTPRRWAFLRVLFGSNELKPTKGNNMLTWRFWRETLERALKTAAQSVLLAWGGGDVIADLFAMDFQIALGAAAGGAVLSVLTSIVSAPIGADDSPSAIE